MCLALSDPRLEVVACTATGGNVTPEQATRNVQAIVEQIDPPRWPRIGAADPMQSLLANNRQLYGQDGLCGADFGVAELHNRHHSVKIIAEEIHSAPGELTIIAGGPLTNLAAVLQREPDLATQVGHLIIVGGTYNGPGNVTAAAEFNIYNDAQSAQHVFRSPITKTLFPLDVSSTADLELSVLEHLPDASCGIGRLLHTLLPGAFLAHHESLGRESISVPEAIAVVAAVHPELLTTQPFSCDVETAGTIAHGATVLDRRPQRPKQHPNMDVVIDLDTQGAVDSMLRTLKQAD
jgi:purine nucleosidase